MPSFRPPDIDPALTQEAQQVVDQASARMEDWLKEAFAKLETEFDNNLQAIQQQLDQERQAFLQEEQHQATQLIEQLQQLKTATQYLTPMDPDQDAVIRKIASLVEQSQAELAAREQRWRNFGSKAVTIAHTGIKTLLKGVI